MQFIDPSYEVFKIPDVFDGNGVLKFLEKIGRVCYKSEERITTESAKGFLADIRNRKHWAMLEHYIFVFAVSKKIYDDVIFEKTRPLSEDINDWILHEKLKFIEATYCGDSPKGMEYIISGSATAFNYIWECKRYENYIDNGVVTLCHYLAIMYPDLMKNPWDHHILSSPDIIPLTRYQIRHLPVGVRLIHDSMTVKFITDRGVSHEIVRHRPASYAQESTRYVNYSKRGMTYIIPPWLSKHDHDLLLDSINIDTVLNVDNPYELSPVVYNWIHSLEYSADSYLNLLAEEWIPQQARSVLPNEVKTEIVMTARMIEWRHFFMTRADKLAHPQMKQLARPLFLEQSVKKPELFLDLKDHINLED